MSVLRIDDNGFVSIDGTRVGALAQSIEIGGGVLMEREATEDTSGKTANFTGFDDAKIRIELRVLGDKKYGDLAQIMAAFKKLENGLPVIYALDFRVARAMGIETAIISTVRTNKGSGVQNIGVSVELTETDPAVQSTQQQQQQQRDAPQPIEDLSTTTLAEANLSAQEIRRYELAQGNPQAGGI